MKIETAVAPELVILDLLPHRHFILPGPPPFLPQMNGEHVEDGGFHGLVRASGFDKTAEFVLDGIAEFIQRV